MNNWEFSDAEILYERVTDGTHDSPKAVSEGFPLVTSKNIKDGVLDISTANLISKEDYTEINKRSKVDQWDVIISMIGEYCGYTYIEKNTNINYAVKNVGLFKTGSKIEANWLSYYLQSGYGKHFLKQSRSGSSQPYISLGALRSLKILNPPINIKRGIVNVLEPIDSKIELNNKINAELEAIAKTIYDFWFVQFDFPNAKGKPYKTSGGKMVWNEELKREIPVGWEVELLGTEIEIQRGISYTSKEINGEGIPMINLASFNLDGTYKPEGVKNYSGKFTEKNIVRAGELLIAATDVTRNADIIGKAILVPDYYNKELVFSMDIAKIISNNIPSSYLMMLFNSNHYHNYIKWYASGTIVLHLNLDGVKRYNMELPPKHLLEKFHSLYQPIAERIYKTALENKKLAQLRDWLLPMLMNGQVKVGDAKKMMEEKLSMAAEPQIVYKKSK